MRKIDTIAVHCSASRPNKRTNASTIRNWHTWPLKRNNGTFLYKGKTYRNERDLPVNVRGKRGRGWNDIGYHFVITTNGLIEGGRPVQQIGAHVKGHNKTSIGICLIGGVDAANKPVANFNKAQLHSLRVLIRYLETVYPIKQVKGHREFLGVNKSCPCFEVNRWLRTGRVYP